MDRKRLLISINSCWNFVNFRTGLMEGLGAAGYEILAAAAPDAHCDRLKALGYRFFELPLAAQGLSPLEDLRLFLAYVRIMRRERPAAFLGYTIKPNIYGSLAAHFCGVPVINNVAGLGTAFIRRNWLTTLVQRLYRSAFRRSSTIFFQNSEDLDQFVGAGLASPSQAKLLPGSGIDLVRFAPAPTRAEPPFTFLLIGRILADKGVREFAAAAELLRARLPDARFQLLGALEAPNRTAIARSELEHWIAAGRIEYLGESEDVRGFIAAADCIVLPSYREGLPRTLLEGAAMARPLIATDVPGCRAVVDHGRNGFLCAARDADALAAAMLEMARLPADRRAELGAAGRSKMEKEFGEEIVIARYLEAVAEALST